MAPTVSIVIVSRHRSAALRRCLIAISQLDHAPFEIVIVADPASCTALREIPQAAHAKLVAYDEANISEARNHGINAAAGEIVAFIDDDAVPEPTWLKFLIAPFARADIAAAGGFVRGRNGISWQYRARTVDRFGQSAPIALEKDVASVLVPDQSRAIKTEGTNMAVRRNVLAELGGFDPRFRFFLDETDLNLRLAARGLRTAIVPLAEVHHGFAASERRRADRVPRDLREIGASWAVFLQKHCPANRRARTWEHVQAEERRRLLTHMVAGRLEPRDLRRLMRGLEEGYEHGIARQPEATRIALVPPTPFQPVPARHGFRSVVLSGRIWRGRHLRRRAFSEATSGSVVTLFLLSPTALFHRVRFTPEGYWLHSGGLFGKSRRTQRLFRLWSFRGRVRAETERVRLVRGLP